MKYQGFYDYALGDDGKPDRTFTAQQFCKHLSAIFGNGIVITLGTGNGAYDFTTYTRFTFLYDNNEVVVPKHFASTESFLAAFANHWSLIKQSLETTIKTKLKEYQEKYEKKTIKIQKTLKDVANFEI